MSYLLLLLENLRYYVFWFVDTLKGGKIYKHLKEITFLNEEYANPKAYLLRNKRLNEILEHTCNNVPYYKNVNSINLNDFPVVDKNIIRNNYNQFCAASFLNKKTKLVSTSGSTGANFSIHKNQNKILRNTADTIYFSKKAGFKIGNRLIYSRHWDEDLRKSKLKNWIINVQEEEIANLNDKNIKRQLEKIGKYTGNKVWMNYPSALTQFCKYFERTNSKVQHLNVNSIITTSEALDNYTKTTTSSYFNTPVVSRYSNTENGIIAQQHINGGNDFTINWGSYFIEILDFDKDIQVNDSELGRIVITDLYNYATPLIRYDTGDIGCIDYNSQPPVFKQIEGRKGDLIINTKGEIINHFIVTDLVLFENVLQGQLIQNDRTDYTLKLNVSKTFNDQSKVIKRFKNYLGEDAQIHIELVEEIPVLSSGKRRLTVNNYIQQK